MSQIILSDDSRYSISGDMANLYRVIPASFSDSSIEFYIDENSNQDDAKEELEMLLGKEITFIPSSSAAIEKALSLHYRKEHQTREKKTLAVEKSDFLENLLDDAKSLKCSDIHVEIFEETARIRFRIDGQLLERYQMDREKYPELINKIKIRAKLNITEKRLPQDGRITSHNFDLRVSILPTLFGEKIVLRLLGQDASNITLESLGMRAHELKLYEEAVKKPHGIILISGPTGSGKTTTLYATLRLLNDSKRNIVTVEDPIEYTLKGINQVQLREDIGLSFAKALKTFLRQDPDVIMLGEIRDPETALMAIRASLTGHLVLSTIHTNSAVGTIARLADMGVPLYLIAETLNLSVAQRLIRKLCNNCKQEQIFEFSQFPKGFDFPYEIETVNKPVGCNKCFHTGYKGRIAIYEILPILNKTAAMIKNNQISDLINSDSTHKSIPQKAFDLLATGETSLEEIFSILINL